MLTLPPNLLRLGERVYLALSGGGDSTAALHLLAESRRTLGLGLFAVHIHHGLRGAEADADQAFCQALCDRLGVALTVHIVDTRAHAAEHRETLEEAARTLRYGIFRELLAGGHAETVLTAHTLDDQAETVLMKLLRGAWLEGLSGIAPVLPEPGGRILRPLLGVRRAELRAYLETLSEPWREDGSNADEAFTRNRVRQTVLPALRLENPSIDRTLANLAELAREEEARWQVEMARVLPQLMLPGKPVRGGGRSNSTAPGARSLAIELDRLRPLDPALRRRVVRAAARQLGISLSFDETARLLMLAGCPPGGLADPTVPTRPGAKLRLASGLQAERSMRELRLAVSGPLSEPAWRPGESEPGSQPEP